LIIKASLASGEVSAGAVAKADQKLSVLRSVKLLSRQTLDILYKLTVRSVIDYALAVYYKTLKQTEMSESLQYRAAKIVSGALHYTSKDKLNDELGWETITERGNLLSLILFHKIHLHETRPLVRKCMPKLNLDNNYKIRNKGVYFPFPHMGDIFNLSFSPNTTKLWKSLKNQTQLFMCEIFILNFGLGNKNIHVILNCACSGLIFNCVMSDLLWCSLFSVCCVFWGGFLHHLGCQICRWGLCSCSQRSMRRWSSLS
jgi:hypothetical protein